MNFIDMTAEEYVKVETIDKQHEKIAKTINDIYDSQIKQNSKAVQDLLAKLLEELEIHFETEEKLMKGNRFPGYFSHKLEHDRFYNNILHTAEQIKLGTENLDEEKFNGIKRWFFNHIEINDKKCGKFLNSIGIS